MLVKWIFLTLWGWSLPLQRQALSAAARAHWPHLWANKHVNLRQRQYLTSSCVRGSKRGRMCLWSRTCMNLSPWQSVVYQNPTSPVSITSIFVIKNGYWNCYTRRWIPEHPLLHQRQQGEPVWHAAAQDSPLSLCVMDEKCQGWLLLEGPDLVS